MNSLIHLISVACGVEKRWQEISVQSEGGMMLQRIYSQRVLIKVDGVVEAIL